MKRLYVFADFDWLKEPRLIGELSYESLRGPDSYGFCYKDEWLKDYGGLFLSDDLNNYPGQQYTTPGKDIFGCFSDALPYRWGRTLINRREQILQRMKNVWCVGFLHSTNLSELRTFLAWGLFDLRSL